MYKSYCISLSFSCKDRFRFKGSKISCNCLDRGQGFDLPEVNFQTRCYPLHRILLLVYERVEISNVAYVRDEGTTICFWGGPGSFGGVRLFIFNILRIRKFIFRHNIYFLYTVLKNLARLFFYVLGGSGQIINLFSWFSRPENCQPTFQNQMVVP